jgi:hypothetical protein
MSVIDILNSIAIGLTSVPVPKGSICTYAAFGNSASCAVQGFIVQLGNAIPSYNAMLCVYFLCIIRYKKTDAFMAKYEKFMHAFALLPYVLSASVAASFDLLNSVSTMCWLETKERFAPVADIDLQDDIRREGTNRHVLQILLLFTSAMIAIVFFIIIFCMGMVVCSVKTQASKSNSYEFQRSSCTIDSSRGYVPRSLFIIFSKLFSSSSTSSSNNRPSRRKSRIAQDSADTKKQACLYVASFFLSYLFPIIIVVQNLILQQPSLSFTLSLFQAVFQPLQGFWNCLAFIRPRFLDMRRTFPNESFWTVLKRTILHLPQQRYHTNDNSNRRSQINRYEQQHGSLPSSTLSANISGPSRNNDNSANQRIVQQKRQKPYGAGNNDEEDYFVDGDYEGIDSPLKPQNFPQCITNEAKRSITLSLLVAEDILPDTPFEFKIHNRRRRSVIECIGAPLNNKDFDTRLDDDSDNDSYDDCKEEENGKASFMFPKKLDHVPDVELGDFPISLMHADEEDLCSPYQQNLLKKSSIVNDRETKIPPPIVKRRVPENGLLKRKMSRRRSCPSFSSSVLDNV